MKLLILLLAFLVFPTHAQTKPPATSPTWSQVPFDPAATNTALPHSPRQIAAAVFNVMPPIKTDFETDAQYRKRVAEWIVPLYGTIKSNDVLAFSVNALGNWADHQPRYFAEAEAWRTNFYIGDIERPSAGANILLDQTTVPIRSYIGQNAFGVKKRITTEAVTRWNINIATGWRSAFVAAVRMPPDEAKRTLISILFVGKLKPPFATLDKRVIEATMSDPRDQAIGDVAIHLDLHEIVIFDLLSKRIIERGPPEQYINKFDKASHVTTYP